MDIDRIKDAAKDLNKAQLDVLAKAIDDMRAECIACGAAGAEAYAVRKRGKADVRGQLMLCVACFTKNRLPESRQASPE